MTPNTITTQQIEQRLKYAPVFKPYVMYNPQNDSLTVKLMDASYSISQAAKCIDLYTANNTDVPGTITGFKLYSVSDYMPTSQQHRKYVSVLLLVNNYFEKYPKLVSRLMSAISGLQLTVNMLECEVENAESFA